jgi:PAS domain S-box-containing protein
MPLRILIVDDYTPVRRGIRSLLSSRADWSVCGEAGDGVEATQLARELRPDLILMDLSMPNMNGVEATRIIRKEVPEAGVIIVSQNHPEAIRQVADQLGAKGYVSKTRLAQDLIPAILGVLGGPNGAENANTPCDGAAERASKSDLSCLAGGGQMGAMMRSLDWSRTPVGPVNAWPQALRVALRILLGSGYPMAIAWGPEFTFFYNDGYRPILGRTKHPALGKRTKEIFPEAWDFIGPLFERVLKKGEDTTLVNQIFFLDRKEYLEECYFTFSYSPVPDDRGAVGGVLVTVIETTDQVIEERRLRTLQDLATEVAKLKSEREICEAAARVFTRNPEDLPFTIFYLTRPKKHSARLMATSGIAPDAPISPAALPIDDTVWPLERAIKSGSTQVVTFAEGQTSAPPSGWGEVPKHGVVVPIALPGRSEPAGFFITGVNPRKELDRPYRAFLDRIASTLSAEIANVRTLEAERERAEDLAELDRAKTAFFSNVSHEFRTPLTLMLGPLEDLIAGKEPTSADHDQLALIHRNGLRLLKLVNTLLDFSRLEAGKMQAVYQATDLAVLTAELASNFESAIDRARLRLSVDCPPLPEQVYVDRDMWEKIVLNLVSNALKFTLEGEIAVQLKPSGEHVELSVRDTGTGIPVEEIPHIFERFHRVQNAQARTNEGTGIGLALVRELVKLHGGSIEVESVAGRGTTFTVSIPLGAAHLPANRIGAARAQVSTAVGAQAFVAEALRWLPADNPPVPSAATSQRESSSVEPSRSQVGNALPRARILLADDNADMREYVRRLLREQYEVMAVSDGQAALTLAREQPPELILADVMMPRLDGSGLLREIRTDPALKGTPVILLSARAGEESRIEGLESGADDYLVKPFSARELLARVASHITIARMRREAVELERKLRAEADLERTRLRELFMQAPAAICLLTGPEHRYTFVNLEYLKVTGRQRAEDFLGKTVREALPEVVNQGFLELLDGVYRTGVPQMGKEAKAILKGPGGAPQERYFNFVFEAQRNIRGDIEGVLGHAVDVTAQVLAQQEIKKSEQRLREMFDALPAAIYTTDREGYLTYFNPAAVELAGRQPQLGVDRWCVTFKLFRPDGTPLPHDECPMAVALKESRVLDGAEMIAERPDGIRRWVMPYPRLIRGAQGGITGAVNMLVDVTERKQAERTTALLASIVDSSDDAIVSKNLDGIITSWNKAAERVFGYTAVEAIGQHITLIIPPDRWDEETEILARLRRGERIDHFETIRNRKDEALIHVSVTISPIKDMRGRVIGASKVARDITERKRAEERERQITAEAFAATAKFRAVFDQSPVFAAIITKEGVLVEANEVSLEPCGYRAEEVLGRPYWETGWWRKFPESQEKIRAAIPLASQGVPFRETLQYSWADGTERLVDFALYPILDREGNVLFLHPTGVDITDLKRAEERYRKLAAMLDSEVRARTSELEDRNADVVRQSEQLRELSWRLLHAQDEERRRIARELHDSAGQMLSLLGMRLSMLVETAKENALDLVKPAEETLELVQQLTKEIRTTSYLLHPPLLDETGLPAALSWYIQGVAERSGLEVAFKISENFGRLTPDMELVVFRLVQECLTNVHRHSGSKTAAIEITQEADRLLIEVRDQGTGISPGRLVEIHSKGSGVGIRGIRERLRQFGGEMIITSTSSGTTVIVTIPVAAQRQATVRDVSQTLRSAV